MDLMNYGMSSAGVWNTLINTWEGCQLLRDRVNPGSYLRHQRLPLQAVAVGS